MFGVYWYPLYLKPGKGLDIRILNFIIFTFAYIQFVWVFGSRAIRRVKLFGSNRSIVIIILNEYVQLHFII